MLNRRSFCGCASLALFAGVSAAHAQSPECAVFTPARQKEVSPDQAIERLKAGNDRFASGKTVNCNLMQQVKETAHGQAPFAAVVGCIDSRVPPEMVFDQRIGDIFCGRVAGNIVNTDLIGSLEYATKVVGARAIVVLGHSECGAVKSAVDDVKLGNITSLQAVAEANARLAAQKLTQGSAILREMVEAKQLRIASAMHDIGTGKVTFLA